jgi:PAS domain S-box-containing protein
VVNEARRFGTLYLQVDLGPMYARLWRYVWTAALVFAGALGAAFLIGFRLQRAISSPVLSLAETARVVSRDRNYNVRASPASVTELGALTVAFNQMLDTIQQQQALLQSELAERTRAQEAEAREKQLLAITLASIGDAVVVTDPAGRVTSLNPEAERLTGWSITEATGRLLPEVFQIINEDTRATVENPVEKVLRLGTVVGLANHTLLIRKDGSEVPIDDSAAPIRQPGGPLFGVVLVFRDSSVQKKAELALRESEARERARASETEAIMEAVPAIIWIARDPDCRRIDGNRASYEFLRLSPSANVSLSAADPGDRPAHFDVRIGGRVLRPDELPVQRAARGERVTNLEEEVYFHDGSSRWLLGNATPLRNANGDIYGAVAAFVDISERKQVEGDLRRARDELVRVNSSLDKTVQERTARLEEMVAELQHVSYAIAHDMRAPLRAMGTFAELLQEEISALGAAASAQEYCRRMKVAAGRLDRLINDALNYSKAVLQQPDLDRVNLAVLIRGLIETYPNLHADSADIAIEDHLPPVVGNESLLTQCFSNLLGNAVKFVPPGARPNIRIRVAQPAVGFTRVVIEDNGIGIPEHAMPRLFGMFQKLDNRYEGTGIGLAIVRKVVERMGGKVGVQSEPGKGSRFWVELKLAEDS